MGLADFSQVREIGMTACNDLRCLGQLLRWLICLLNHTSWERARLLNLARLCIFETIQLRHSSKGLCREQLEKHIQRYETTNHSVSDARNSEQRLFSDCSPTNIFHFLTF